MFLVALVAVDCGIIGAFCGINCDSVGLNVWWTSYDVIEFDFVVWNVTKTQQQQQQKFINRISFLNLPTITLFQSNFHKYILNFYIF